ncbi:MAG: heparan-alpha-glucosaminide N-acetyltransferase domain-containing protein [Bacteroidota bacterium]
MKSRNLSIDATRGLAIFTMIAANMAAYNLAEPHPFIFRLYGSFAAPSFVFLSGILVPYIQKALNRNFLYFTKRGIATIVVAGLIDVFIWKLFPFSSFDVLYIIGISLIINYIFCKINSWLHLIISLLFFITSPFLQIYFGYADNPFEIALSEDGLITNWFNGPTIKNFLIEGWFPIFPWLGVSLLGSFTGRTFFNGQVRFKQKILIYTGIIMMFLGIITWSITNPVLMTRSGYSELFYPPKICYFLTFLGFILFLISSIEKILPKFILDVLSVYGQSSLLMYIMHSFLIAFLFSENFPTLNFLNFLQLYLFHAMILWWMAKFLQLIKPYLKNSPFPIRFLLGT